MKVGSNKVFKSSDEEIISRLLLTHEQMMKRLQDLREKELKGEFSYPYVFGINKSGGAQVLIYLGIQHTTDLKNFQIPIVRNQWKLFLQDTEKKDRMVFVEGKRKPTFKSEEEAIGMYTEGGLVSFWATEKNIEVVYPDADKQMEVDGLLKQFSAEKIVDYWFTAGMSQRHMVKDKENYLEFLENHLREIFRGTAIEDHDFEINNLIKVFENLHGRKFDIDDAEGFKYLSNPSYSEVARASKEFRDIRIVSLAKKHRDEGKSLFVVYGSGHAITQEPALKELLK